MPEELLDEGNALGMLRAEHVNINSLMSNVSERDPVFAQQALMRLREELDIHRAMERQYFIPLCQRNTDVVKPDRLALGTRHDATLDELISQVNAIDVTHPDFARTMEQLTHTFHTHSYEMEETMFIALEGGDWDMHNQLVACAMQMRELRDHMRESQKRRRAAEGPSFQNFQQHRAQEMGRGEYPPRDIVSDSEEGAAGR